MSYFAERVLTEELGEAKVLLERALVILDDHEENAAACYTSEALAHLIGAPSTIVQWYMMTGRNSDGSERH